MLAIINASILITFRTNHHDSSGSSYIHHRKLQWNSHSDSFRRIALVYRSIFEGRMEFIDPASDVRNAAMVTTINTDTIVPSQSMVGWRIHTSHCIRYGPWSVSRRNSCCTSLYRSVSTTTTSFHSSTKYRRRVLRCPRSLLHGCSHGRRCSRFGSGTASRWS